MSPPQTDPPPAPLWKKPWFVLTGLALVATPVLGVATGAIGIVEKAVEWFCPPSPALVRITREPVTNGPTCLKFSFERLPSDFTLGNIRFTVTATSELRSTVSIAARSPYRNKEKDMKVPTDVMKGEVKEIKHSVEIQAEKENDAAIVSVCPVPAHPGTSVNLTVVPSFLSLAGNPIENIEIGTDDGSSVEKGIELVVVRYPSTSGTTYQTE